MGNSQNKESYHLEVKSEQKEEIYLKITNAEEKHYGYQYKDGLNVLDKEFQTEGSCVPGGLYFTDIHNIDKFFRYGVNLRIVRLPKDNPNFKMVKDPEGDKWRANMIILGEKYSLFDIETYEKINVNFLKKYILDEMPYVPLSNNYNRVYEFCLKHKLEFYFCYTENAIDNASANGCVEALEWWEKMFIEHNIRLKYTSFKVICNIKANHIDVLNWWLKMHLKTNQKTQSRRNTRDCSVPLTHTPVNNKQKINFREFSIRGLIEQASTDCRIDILDWFLDAYLKHKIPFRDHLLSKMHVMLVMLVFLIGSIKCILNIKYHSIMAGGVYQMPVRMVILMY